ncbi:MAG: response regulator transcription factor [Oscillospiraceae bacterium]|jgi:two-component system response regulator VicR|nr:response regulator transcription factor [Oscillospiraceae bacterium]
MKKTVLIIEDEKPIVDILAFHLQRSGYETLAAMDGESGLKLALEKKPDLILLDVMLPKMDGFTVCKAIRRENAAVPILMLTAREEENDKVMGLDLGADDYITKPFAVKELLARVGANIRRVSVAQEAAAAEADVLEAGRLRVHTGRMEVSVDGSPVDLSQREYDLLLFLMRSAGAVASREDLMHKVWNYDYMGDLRVVDVAIRRLREKIEPNPAEPVYILTKRGAGYLFSGGANA